ncbi:secretion protein HlyD [Deltaproteobacteria bacterium Smac51]|nr:secretion protein HlyD [Deltaproteobacteria bacterium Smac51]
MTGKRNIRNLTVSLIAALLLTSSCSSGPETYQGYVEGEFLYLASSQSGRLNGLAASSGFLAEKGQPLFTLDGEYETTLVKQAEAELAAARDSLADLRRGLRETEIAAIEAQIAQARAALENSASNYKRIQALYASRTTPKSQLDAARAEAEADAAKVEQLESQLATALSPTGRDEQIAAQAAKVAALEAAVEQAQWRLDEKVVAAPAAGLVFDIFFRPGEWVGAGNPVVRFLPPENVKVRFFVPEAAFSGLSHGQKVALSMDGRSEPVAAVISYLAPEAEYSPPVIYSNERREKLLFMVEARPVEAASGLKPGQPVTVRPFEPDMGGRS